MIIRPARTTNRSPGGGRGNRRAPTTPIASAAPPDSAAKRFGGTPAQVFLLGDQHLAGVVVVSCGPFDRSEVLVRLRLVGARVVR